MNNISKFSYFFVNALRAPPTSAYRTSLPQTTEIIEKRLPAPTPQGRAEQIRRGHQGRGEARGGGSRAV
ncbi:MAG: hypothetical protein HF974_04345 [ANME-2 cluster archaeon]|nr:hypothetical protein [ANME-2 cluster archaeon]